MNLLKENKIPLWKIADLVTFALVILFCVFKPHSAGEEKKRPSRIHTENGQTFIEVNEEEQSLNGIEVQKLKSFVYQPTHRARGWVIPFNELGFYISPVQLEKMPEVGSYIYIEPQADESLSKDKELKVSVSLSDDLSVEAEKVDLSASSGVVKSKILYRIPKKSIHQTLAADVTLLISDSSSKDAMLLPESAVVWTDGKAWVYTLKNPGHFFRKKITLLNFALPDTKACPHCLLIQADHELENGFVAQGAQQLQSEESIAEIGEGAE